MKKNRACVFLITACISTMLSAETELDQPRTESIDSELLVHQYRTRDEKRNAAQQYEITHWLSVSAVVEVEQTHQRNTRLENLENRHSTIDDFSKSLDIEITIDPSAPQETEATEYTNSPNNLSSEIVLEYDDEKKKFLVDEAIAKIELENNEIELGKLYVPFGEYNSYFITGPSLEFAETRAKGIVFSHEFELSEKSLLDKLDLSLYAFRGKAKKQNSKSRPINWGIATEFNPKESWAVGIGYISNLADGDDISFEDTNNRYLKRVDGFGLYSTFEFSTEKLGELKFSTEYISALDDFNEFEADRNRPKAWNIELAHFPVKKIELAVRLAGSSEIEDEPNRQWGIATTWHINKKINLSLEYLNNDYKNGLVEDDQEELLKSSNQMGGRISIIF